MYRLKKILTPSGKSLRISGGIFFGCSITKIVVYWGMNFLAHIYLSGDDDMVKIGNFMADSIHGRKPESFPDGIRKGIMLHRAIDTFTDSHPVFRQSTKRLHANYHHYAGVIADVYYDHFLAKNWSRYHDASLENFAEDFYRLLQDNFLLLAEQTKQIVPYMIRDNWLAGNAHLDGIARTLRQIDRRTNHKSGMASAINELQEFYGEFEAEFLLFFEAVRTFAGEKIKTL